MKPEQLEYAAPEPMSRKRLGAIVGAAAFSGIVIGGVTYVLAQPTTVPVVMGEMVAPPVVTTQPSMPPVPGALPPATQQWEESPKLEKSPASSR